MSKTKSAPTLYKFLDHNYIIFPVTLAATFFLCCQLANVSGLYKAVVSTNDDWNFKTVLYIILNVSLIVAETPPYAKLWGLCLPMNPFRYAHAPRMRAFRRLRVCLVTKGTNIETVINSIRAWTRLATHDDRVNFYLLIDEPNIKFEDLPGFVNVVNVPEGFVSGKARYKARALEYFRESQVLTKEDWVLHLDEECIIDDHVIQACLDFIERGTDDIGMGTIHYNTVNHWTQPFLSAAEVTRISEDWGRFQLPVRYFRRPLLGWMHGSWVLINGEVETEITWDTSCLAEDFWFAYQAAARGYKFGWLHAIVREQPPETMRDFFRQRRRWYTGILSIDSTLVRMSLVSSVVGSTTMFCVPTYIFLGGNLLVPRWLFFWIFWNLVSDAYAVAVASILQDIQSRHVSWFSLAENAMKSILLAPIVNLVQAGALCSCLLEPAKGFDIIAKQ